MNIERSQEQQIPSSSTGEAAEKKEANKDFNWHDYEPDWIGKIRAKNNPSEMKELAEKEAQMDAIAELLTEEGFQFFDPEKLAREEAGVSLMQEEGLYDESQAAFELKQVRRYNSPLLAMIGRGRSLGVVTSDEAKELAEWYGPPVH